MCTSLRKGEGMKGGKEEGNVGVGGGGGKWRRGLGEEQNGLRGRVKGREGGERGREKNGIFNILSLTWGHLKMIESGREREVDRQIDRGRERER